MKILEKLTQTNSASGNESGIASAIENEIKAFVDEIKTDALGNLIAIKKGNGQRIMLAAHMDEIGIIVTFIDDKGFIRFSNVGRIYKKNIVGRRVIFSNGIKGVIFTENENKNLDISKMYIDIGAEDKLDAEKSVSIGDTATFEGSFYEAGTRIVSKALDNRAGCYCLIEAAKRIKTDNEVYFVFTTQEEIGLRGARTSAYSINPDVALAIDVTDTGDTPNGEKMAVQLGKGAAIKVMDRSVICDSDVRTTLIELAKKNNIPYQLEVMTAGGTDAGVIHTTGEGVKTGGISIPTRYIHSPSEMADKRDIHAVVELIVKFSDIKGFGSKR